MPQTDVIPLLPPFLTVNPLIFEQGNPLYWETPPPLISCSLENTIYSPSFQPPNPVCHGSLPVWAILPSHPSCLVCTASLGALYWDLL